MIKKVLSAALTLTLMFSTVSYAEKTTGAIISSEILQESIDKRLDIDNVMGNMSYFSEEIGERFAGSQKEKESAEYIYNYFEELGYEMELQEVPIVNKRGALNIVGDNEKNILAYRTLGTFGEEFLGGSLIDCKEGGKEEITDEISGNIAIIKRGENVVNAIKEAINKGATGIAVYNNVEGSFRISLGDYNCTVPVVLIPKADGEYLTQKINNSQEAIEASIGQYIYDKTWNVIATKKATEVENPEVLHVTAHYDSVAGSPGANDNASAAAMLMEFGRLFKDYETKADIKFVAFGAEEIGLKGSKYYVQNLTEEEKTKSIGNINMDMIGTNYEECTQLAIETVAGDTHKVTDSILNAGKKLGREHYFVSKYGGSDHVSFHNAGINEVTFIWVIPNTNDNGIEPWYHTYEDTMDKISPERLREMGELISTSIYDISEAQPKVEEEIQVSKVIGLKASEINTNSVKLTWKTPENTVGLTNYVIYKDGKAIAEVEETTFEVLDLRANTIYGLKVASKYSNGKISKPVSINIRTKK